MGTPSETAARSGATSKRAGDPAVALLLTWFLPGAGHLYLGKTVTGLAALLLVEGLYALGWFLSEGRVFELLDPELRGPMATILTPEFGNLGGMITQLRVVGYGPEQLQPFSSTMVLGGMLTALSGIANFFLMAHVHLTARTPSDAPRLGLHPTLTVAAGWAVPGLGHLLQGRRLRALIVFTLLVGFFVLGTLMAEGTNLSRERHFYYWSGQLLVGLPALVAEGLFGDSAVTHEIPRMDIGLLYGCMAGLLNILALLDVQRFAEARWFRTAATPSPEPEAVASSEVAS